VAAVTEALSSSIAGRLAQAIPAGRLLLVGLLAGGPLCAALGFGQSWVVLLVVRAVGGLALGGTITLAYTLGGLIARGRERGAVFGTLAMGVMAGTAASPLVTGAIAAVSLPGAFLFTGALAWAGAGLMLVAARDLLGRRAPGDRSALA
jgi:MFS family permease